MATSSTTNLPEKIEKRSFEDWCDHQIRERPDYVVLRTNVLWYGSLVNLTMSRANLISIGKEHGGMRKADSEEFKEAQKIWWYYYRKIMVLRSFVLRYFDIPAPNWRDDILPEREYCGVLLSEEDFQKFLTEEGSGIKIQKPESVESYEQELKDNRMTDRKRREKLLEEEEEEPKPSFDERDGAGTD